MVKDDIGCCYVGGLGLPNGGDSELTGAVTRRTLGPTLLALSIAFGSLLLAGCGDSGGSDDGARTAPANDTTGGQAAVDSYRHYLAEQTQLLVDRTQAFVKALNYGNVEQAKRLYPTTRMPYEAVEPVAESFGTLDPDIDAREGDVPAASSAASTGSRKRSGWTTRRRAWRSVAAKLLADIKRLQAHRVHDQARAGTGRQRRE